MTETYIKRFDGYILGIIETEANGDQTARDYQSRQILGYYRADRDVTTDFYGRTLTHGNTVASLINSNK